MYHRLMHKHLTIWLAIAGLLMGLIGPQPAYAMPKAAQPQQIEPDDYVDLQWNITATGYSDRTNGDIRIVEKRNVKIHGSALIRVPKEGIKTAVAKPMFLTVTDDYDSVETTPCQTRKEQHTITDPGRWSGGPDLFWVLNGEFRPLQIDGQWQLLNPFGGNFYVRDGSIFRTFTYQQYDYLRRYGGVCGSNLEEETTSEQRIEYVEILRDLWMSPLMGDTTGTFFSFH